VLPWSPLGGDCSVRAREGGEGRRANERLKRSIEKHRAALEAYEALCRELGESPADVALRWLLGQPESRRRSSDAGRWSSSTARSTRSRSGCRSRRSNGSSHLAGPGGEAPEAFAW